MVAGWQAARASLQLPESAFTFDDWHYSAVTPATGLTEMATEAASWPGNPSSPTRARLGASTACDAPLLPPLEAPPPPCCCCSFADTGLMRKERNDILSAASLSSAALPAAEPTPGPEPAPPPDSSVWAAVAASSAAAASGNETTAGTNLLDLLPGGAWSRGAAAGSPASTST